MKSLLVLALVLMPFSFPSLASQALLECKGPKIELEAWFIGNSYPELVSIYKMDPALGIPSEYSVLDFEWTEDKLEFNLVSIHPQAADLEFHLLPDHINGGYSGTLHVVKGYTTSIFPDHHCDFH